MRVFVCEFVTGGGMRGQQLPPSLAREGAIIRDALIADLRALEDVHVATTHDDRLMPPSAESEAIAATTDSWSIWSQLAAGCDLAWPIAPESGGMLERLTRLIDWSGAVRIGSDPEAIRITASKIRTAQLLQAYEIPTVPTYPLDDLPGSVSGPLVTKPDDGAGCSETRLWSELPSDIPDSRMVVQPFIDGTPVSLSMLCMEGRAVLLSVNRQHVTIHDGAFRFEGVTIGAIQDDGGLAQLAQDVMGAVPGLRGIIGIDVILTPGGPMVVDVNPRLTTSHVGLHRLLGCNPATLIPELAHNPERVGLPGPSGYPIEFRI